MKPPCPPMGSIQPFRGNVEASRWVASRGCPSAERVTNVRLKSISAVAAPEGKSGGLGGFRGALGPAPDRLADPIPLLPGANAAVGPPGPELPPGEELGHGFLDELGAFGFPEVSQEHLRSQDGTDRRGHVLPRVFRGRAMDGLEHGDLAGMDVPGR